MLQLLIYHISNEYSYPPLRLNNAKFKAKRSWTINNLNIKISKCQSNVRLREKAGSAVFGPSIYPSNVAAHKGSA